ncbi:ArgE/DapE family deacylase [Lactiplantibacillus daowaiensis]|uniref:Probable succinyl-diaminopimelate desuccinylase n=1 Tax=Lactiplantibacillus daowaiensis TaxID=2559918 RepID=A0ABW1S292_9LACO|nr:ArgE/DapE family deacylase [Lactiplantibacillus daowaiensis]
MEKAEKIDILRHLVSINSVNGNEIEVAHYLETLFSQAGIDCQVLPEGDGRANLVAEIGAGQPVLAISGHMDTVAVNPDDWATDPFTLTTDGDHLIGRGANDMKSGLAALVIAMIELKEQQVPLNGTIRLLATYGEEFAEKGAQSLTTAGYMQGVDALMIAEPSGYRICYGQAGSIDMTVTSEGKTAHSSMPSLGQNAVMHLVDVLYQIQTNITKLTAGITNDVLSTPTLFNIDVFHGGNQVNTIPNYASAQVNLRTIPEVSNQKLLQVFEETIRDYNQEHGSHIGHHAEMVVDPVVGDAHSKMIQLIQKIGQPYLENAEFTPAEQQQNQQALKMMGLPTDQTTIPILGAAGGTDARRFLIDHLVGADYTVFGPGNLTSHQPNEYISAKMYLDFIEMYEQLFPAYLQA